jgi:hypothetical protein
MMISLFAPTDCAGSSVPGSSPFEWTRRLERGGKVLPKYGPAVAQPASAREAANR